jgi:WD40 repeat protein
VAFRPDGTTLVMVNARGILQFCRLTAGARTVRTLELEARGHVGPWIESAAFSADGRVLATGSSDSSLQLWDVETGRLWNTYNGHLNRIEAVAFSRNGRRLASGSFLREKNPTQYPEHGDVRIWDVGGTPEVSVAKPESVASVNALEFWPKGQRVVSLGGTFGALTTVDTTSGKRLASYDNRGVDAIAHSPTAPVLALGRGNEIVLLNPESFARLDVLADSDPQRRPRKIVSLAYSRDGSWLAAGTFEEGIVVWDVAAKKTVATLKLPSKEYEDNAIGASAFLPVKERLGAASDGGGVTLWDVSRQQPLATLATHNGFATGVAVSPDGKTVVSGGMDGRILLTPVDPIAPPIELRGHRAGVTSVAFSTDGRTIASGGRDGTVRLWQTSSHQPFLVFTPRSASSQGVIRSLRFSPDGTALAAGDEWGAITFWRHAAARP